MKRILILATLAVFALQACKTGNRPEAEVESTEEEIMLKEVLKHFFDVESHDELVKKAESLQQIVDAKGLPKVQKEFFLDAFEKEEEKFIKLGKKRGDIDYGEVRWAKNVILGDDVFGLDFYKNTISARDSGAHTFVNLKAEMTSNANDSDFKKLKNIMEYSASTKNAFANKNTLSVFFVISGIKKKIKDENRVYYISNVLSIRNKVHVKILFLDDGKFYSAELEQEEGESMDNNFWNNKLTSYNKENPNVKIMSPLIFQYLKSAPVVTLDDSLYQKKGVESALIKVKLDKIFGIE